MRAAARTDHVYILIWFIKDLSKAQTRNVLFNFLNFCGGWSMFECGDCACATPGFLKYLADFEFRKTKQTQQTWRCWITITANWQTVGELQPRPWQVPACALHSLTFKQLLVILPCLQLFTRQTCIWEQVWMGNLLHNHGRIIRVTSQLQHTQRNEIKVRQIQFYHLSDIVLD